MHHELPVNITREMKQSYLDYSMSVIVGRALPDVRDGFKPVHRRILYAMFSEGLLSNRKFSKCAGVVGEVLKKYHPHGDSAVYDALVRLAQPWNMRYPLVDGQGNFGSVDGDRAAAYRYTEARMQSISEEMLSDIEKDTVDWQMNFDETTREPLVLPTRYPNLLVNGSSGIAVGMATNMPPHNIAEVTNALLALLENPDLTISELMGFVKAPDFPTGGVICGMRGVREAYQTGKGKVIVRAKARVEIQNDGRNWIIIDEIPYMVNKAKVCEKIAELVKEQRITGISELRDESDRHGMRIVIELKRGEVGEVILNQLFQMTALQTTFGVIMLALVNNQPKVLNLKEILEQFVAFRKDVVLRRTRYLLRKAEERSHILEGFVRALDVLDELIKLIRASNSPADAKAGLMETWDFSAKQAQAILEMRLQKLTGMERDAIVKEYEEIQFEISKLRLILNESEELKRVIREETLEIQGRYNDQRRTQIIENEVSFSVEDLIADENVVVTCSHLGYIKQTPLSLYREQRRGGKGRLGMRTHTDDFVENMFIAATHDYLMVFTNFGKVYWIKVHQIPQTDAAHKGKALVNIIQLEEDEKPVAFQAVRDFEEDVSLVFATRRGVVKKTSLGSYKNIRNNGIKAILIDEDDELIGVRRSYESCEIFLGTRGGKAIRFAGDKVRNTGRSTRGVIGIRLAENDRVVEMAIIRSDEASILTISENGYGKRTKVDDYRLTNRGGSGVLNMRVTEKTGEIAAVRFIDDEQSGVIISQLGKLIRLDLTEVRDIGRVTQGIRFIHLDDPEDRVVGFSLIPAGEDEVLEDDFELANDDSQNIKGDSEEDSNLAEPAEEV